MSFIESINPKIINCEIEPADSLTGIIEEEKSKLYLCKFLEKNLAYTMKLLTGSDGKGLELYPFQEIILKMLFEKDNVLCIMGRGTGKSSLAAWFVVLYCILYPGARIGILSPVFRRCLSKKSLLITDNGFETLENIQINDKVQAINNLRNVNNKWENKKEPGISLQTKRGFSVEGLLDHRILTYNPDTLDFEYKFLKDLSEGNFLPIKYGMNKWGDKSLLEGFVPIASKNYWIEKPCIINEDDLDLYYFLGLVTGDGCINNSSGSGKTKNIVMVTNTDEEILTFIDNFAKKFFPESKVTTMERSGCYEKSISSYKFIQFLYYIGFAKKVKAIGKVIPYKILQCNKNKVAAFLRGLFDTDGSVGARIVPSNVLLAEVKLATSSIEIARTVQLLLLNFGIVSSLYTEKARGEMEILGVKTFGNTAYSIKIFNVKSLEKFQQEIGFGLTRKKKILSDFLNKTKNYETNGSPENNIIVPGSGRYFKTKYNKYAKLTDNISVCHLKKFLEKESWRLDDEDIKKINYILNNKFFYDKVKNIENVESETIDIEVDVEKCYWANGFINHNSKELFKTIQDVINRPGSQLLKHCFVKENVSPDRCFMQIGTSEIIALPLGTSGDKIRGYRFNVVILDEAGFVPEKIITSVIIPFLSTNVDPIERERTRQRENDLISRGLMKESDRIVFKNNKFLAFSSATYQFEYLFSLYKNYKEAILNPKPNQFASYGIFQMSYEAAPPGLLNNASTENAKNSMSVAEFTKEYRAQFPSDSDSYYSMKKMENCTVPLGQEPSVEIYGEKNAKYLVAIDPNSMSEASTADHFAISVFKLNEKNREVILVHQFAACELNITDYIWYFLYILENFNVVCVTIDRSGAQFVNMCNESQMFKDRNLKLDFFEADFEVEEREYVRELNKARRSYNLTAKRICFSQYFFNDWKRNACEYLQYSIEYKKIWFAAEPNDHNFETMLKFNIGNFDKLKIFSGEEKGSDQESRKIDFIEHQKTLMKDVKYQCSLIELKVSGQGAHSFELPSNIRRLRGENQVRRDNFTTLMLGNYMAKRYFDMTSVDEKFNFNSSYRPSVIGDGKINFF